jgi:archaellum component FlaC
MSNLIYTPSRTNSGPFGVGPSDPLAVKIMGTSKIVPDGQVTIERISKTHIGLIVNGSVLFKQLNCFRDLLEQDLESLQKARDIVRRNMENL